MHGLDDELFAEIDSFALVVGWETRRPGPFKRLYRYSRFDAFTECTVCEGSGDAAVTKPGECAQGECAPGRCGGCAGYGRVEKVGTRGGRR
ncbi:hypothetical protein MBA17_22180 [Streptosporangium sp. KLBMP 9127]|nr:hypothetical protein [Streptosporangium sp. KLBMP 9127]